MTLFQLVQIFAETYSELSDSFRTSFPRVLRNKLYAVILKELLENELWDWKRGYKIPNIIRSP